MVDGKKRRLTAAQQLFALRDAQPDSSFIYVKAGVFRWTGKVTPTPISDTYVISIYYNSLDFSAPEVRVITPKLQRRAGQRPPHMYDEKRLCLYLPNTTTNEWSGYKYIAFTILPWTSLWLKFYEMWLPHGDWYGGGAHPSLEAKEKLKKAN